MSFDQNRAAAVRAAIEQTSAKLLSYAALPEYTLVLLEPHLAALLQTERELLSAGEPVRAQEEPWYPDDSGLWVEIPDDCMKVPEGLSMDAEFEVLRKSERETKSYESWSAKHSYWVWNHGPHEGCRIVAYKVVKQ